MNSKGLLLDTNAFILSMEKSGRLTKDLIELIQSPQNAVFLSVASIWEIVLKKEKGKLKVQGDPEKDAQKANFIILPIQAQHVLAIQKLPSHHKDPFDRLLVAQSQVENLTLVSSDRKIWKYDVDVLKF